MQDVLTPENKSEIREACRDLGIKITFKTKCSSCYQDAIVQLWHKMSDGGIVTDSGKYIFTGTRTEYLHPYRIPINQHTPDAIIEGYWKSVCHLFKKTK